MPRQLHPSITAICICLAVPAFLMAQDSFTFNAAGPFSHTNEGGAPPFSARLADFGSFSVPKGTYHGLRASYTVSATNTNARGFDLPVGLYQNTGAPFNLAASIQEGVAPPPVDGSINGGPTELSFDLPIYFFRSFPNGPTPFPGGMVGARGDNGVLNNTVNWSDIELEFYEAEVTHLAGNNHSDGSWNAPIVNPDLGIDLGRTADPVPYTVFPFTVDETGVYGLHSQFDVGPNGRDGITYVFDGEVPLVGSYDNLLDTESQGLFGVGFTDINSVVLQEGQRYTLVQSGESPNDTNDFNSWFAGPGSVTFVPEPQGWLLLLIGVAAQLWRRPPSLFV